MDRMKTFLKYALWLIGFALFSDLIINIGLNSNYRVMEVRSIIPEQVKVFQAETTKVNQRIRGIVLNSEESLNGKYLKVEFYSENDNYLGKKYIAINNITEEKPMTFELFSKLQDVKSYNVSVVDQVEEGSLEIDTLIKEWTKPEIILASTLAFLIFWG